ncbi:outer membrane protein [Thermodesulfobacteriota bacterium]
MNKRLITIMFCCFFLGLPAISLGGLGAPGMYGSFNAGVAIPADGRLTIPGVRSAELEYDTSFTVGGAIGYRLGETGDYRLEGEVAYQNNEVNRIANISLPEDVDGAILSSMEASVLTFLLNAYIDFNYGSAFSWFVTAGAGFARIDGEMTLDGVNYDEDDTVFAYQFGVGAGYAVTETVTLDCKYRYLRTDDFNIEGGDVEVASPSHNITAGIRVAF